MTPVHIVVVTVIVVAAGFAALLIRLCRQVVGSNCKLPVTLEWIETLSVERYRPMLRLLDAQDLSFLESQPGFRRAMASRLRRQRCDIFRGYLKHLCADFQRTCAALKLVMLHSEVDRPDLASALLRSQAAFACGLVHIQLRVTLYRWRLASVDAGELVRLFDVMRLELRTLVPAVEGGLA